MIRPIAILPLAALVALVSVGACTANTAPYEPGARLRPPSAYAEYYASTSPTFRDYVSTTTEPADPDPVAISSAVDAPTPTRTSTPAPEPATSGAEETNLYVYRYRALVGDPDAPAVDALAIASYVCETAIPAGGSVDGAAEHMHQLDPAASLLLSRSVVLLAAQFRCPASM